MGRVSTVWRAVCGWVEESAPPPPEGPFAPRSRAVWLASVTLNVVAAAILVRVATQTFKPFFSVPPPAPLPSVEPAGVKFGLAEVTRREIFAEMATAEFADRDRDIKGHTWKDHAWSQEDDRGYRERALAKSIAARLGINLTQVYLTFEEGIRERWPGPDGKPLSATVPPLDLRHE